MLLGLFRGKRKEPQKLKQGRWKEFNKHAVLISVGEYQHGNKHGRWKEFYDTGELMIEEDFENGIAHGRFATYHLNGKLLSEGTFQNGNREGYFRIYDEYGIQTKLILFKENKFIEEVDKNKHESSIECGGIRN